MLVAYTCPTTLAGKDPAPASTPVPVTAERGEVWTFHMDAVAACRVRAARESKGWNAP
jgi:hypothetical protein